MITREEAAAIAEREALTRRLGTGIRHVYRLHEIPFRKPVFYAAAGVNLEGCWIAYVETQRVWFGPSTILVLDANSGDVVFAGLANDEG